MGIDFSPPSSGTTQDCMIDKNGSHKEEPIGVKGTYYDGRIGTIQFMATTIKFFYFYL